MRTIHKYVLGLVDEWQSVEIPAGAELLSVQMQHGKICVWAIVDTERMNDIQYFMIIGTGHQMPEKPKLIQYLGTVQDVGGALVWHAFQAIK